MKVCYITTTRHNVGDDFVREGITYLLEQLLGPIDSNCVHKHLPVTARPEFEWLHEYGFFRLLKKVSRHRELLISNLFELLPLVSSTDKILNCDLLVQSGAPVLWPRCEQNEWFGPLIKRRYLSMITPPPFINIGAGTCLAYHSEGDELLKNMNTVSYLRELSSLCKVTTVRDSLSRQLLSLLGHEAPIIPCPSLFAREQLGIEPMNPEYVVLNYMPIGGHFSFGQILNNDKWADNFVTFYSTIKDRYPVIIACHDQTEYRATRRLLPDATHFIASTARQYLELYAKARFYIGCRVHAAYAVASFGRPGFVIGTDTRALMAKEIGLESAFVNDVDADSLISRYAELESGISAYAQQFESIRLSAYNAYMTALAPLVKCKSNE